MISSFIIKLRFNHLQLIRDYPQGIKNRFKNTGDKWVQSLRNPHVKTYYDLFQNSQKQQHIIKFHVTQKQQQFIHQVQSASNPHIADLNKSATFNFPTRPNDKQLTRDIKQLTFTKFIQQGKQNFTSIHKLVLAGFGFILVHIVLYFTFYHGKQYPKNQRVKVLNSQLLQSYNFTMQQAAFQKIRQRIKIVNQQYQKQLKQSKII